LNDATEGAEQTEANSPPADETEELPPIDDLEWAKSIFENLGDQQSKTLLSKHSNKVRIVLTIVKEALKLKDNILVFVHSIPTLEYLEEKLVHKNYRVYRLTGQTPVRERQGMIDEFNRTEGAVFLISCKVRFLLTMLIERLAH
jgi:SNF2 family DNA or RNA helicase